MAHRQACVSTQNCQTRTCDNDLAKDMWSTTEAIIQQQARPIIMHEAIGTPTHDKHVYANMCAHGLYQLRHAACMKKA